MNNFYLGKQSLRDTYIPKNALILKIKPKNAPTFNAIVCVIPFLKLFKQLLIPSVLHCINLRTIWLALGLE